MYRSLLVRIKKDKDEKERKEQDQKDKEEKEKEEKLKKEKEKERKKLGSKKSFFGFPNAQPFGKRPQPSLAPEPTTPTTPTAPKDGAEMVKSFALSKPLPPVIKVSISTALKVSESSPSIEPTPPASKPGPVPPASFKLAPSVPPPASRPALSPQKLPTQQLPAQQPRPHQFAHQQSDPRQIPFQQAPPRQHLPPGDGCGQHHGPTPFDLSQSPCFNVPPPGFPQTSIGGQTSIFARPPPTLSSQSPAPPPAPITSQTPGPVIKSLLSLNVPPPEDDHLTAPGESRKRRWEADPGPPCDFSVPPPIKRLEVSPRPESNGGGDTNDSLSRLKSLVEKAVIPLCRSTIEQQHHIKEQTVLTLLTSLREKVVETNLAADAFLQHQESRIGYFLHLDRIVPSPLLDGYRNKCDFAVGVNPVSKKLAVGFRLRPDVPEVGPVDHLRHIPDRIKRVVVKTELLFRDLKMPPFDVKQGTGFWSSVTVRLSKLEQLMLIFTLNPQELNDLELNHIKERIKAFAERQLGTPDKIDSMYLNIKETGHDSGIYEHICGEKLIKEQVLNRVLQISPQSFFPSNTSAAELTYDIIAESAGLHMDSTLVDVCCGVGSIAISLSNRCGQILGLDIATAAVEDARMNALVNDITNGEFHPGSAEEYLGVLWRRAIFGELICVVDPPRTGLQVKAINHLRKEEKIKKVLFLCSDAQSCLGTLVSLCRAPSNVFKGEPFMPVRAVPIDTFPHTNNFSIVFLFVRVPMEELSNPAQSEAAQLHFSTPAFFSTPTSNGPATDPSWNSDQNGVTVTEFESCLNEIQVNWLNSLSLAYGTSFDRKGWAKSMASSRQPETPEEWAEYSKMYSQHMQHQQPQGQPPLPPGGAPPLPLEPPLPSQQPTHPPTGSLPGGFSSSSPPPSGGGRMRGTPPKRVPPLPKDPPPFGHWHRGD